MAVSSLRLRKALNLSSSLIKTHRSFSAIASSSHLLPSPISPSSIVPQNPKNLLINQSIWFRSASYSSRGSYQLDDKIGPDTILFEGCDYQHWLITMDFPKDPKPSPEEMVETYVRTAAQVFGSEEEAKQKIYACSTTTYHGFQVEISEDMSERFRGLPGVVFILPDSYIDPVNKEYGGDKYVNGTIYPRPPPVQHGRQGRYGDRNRNYDQPRNDRQGNPFPNQQGGQPYQGQNRTNYSPQQGYQPQQGSGPQQGHGPQQGYQQNSPPQNYPPPPPPQNYPPPPQQNYPPPPQNYPPPPQQNYPPPQQNYQPQQNFRPQQNYGPPGQGEPMPMGNGNSAPIFDSKNFAPSGGDYQQGAGPSYGRNDQGRQ